MADLNILKKDEETVYKLRSLYENYGYNQFKMNKFEEYDLYVRNKDFLVSTNIISFTDLDGKLMALKPDVTLSIIKNGNDDENALQKVYYNENVYRVPKTSQSFKEIMQVGLECIGNVDSYCVFEVLLLALKSLQAISNDFVLDVSHLGIVKEVMDGNDLSEPQRKEIAKCFGEKNTHDLFKYKGGDVLAKLVSTYGNVEKVGKVLDEIYPNGLSDSAKLLKDVVVLLEQSGYKDKVRIDFSVLNDMNYYSGIVFQGFVKGIPTSVLSGGQYDYLMSKMGRKSKAIGFAVYIDLIERFDDKEKEFDIDVLIVYGKNSSLSKINAVASDCVKNGQSVLVRKSIPEKLKYGRVIFVDKEGE